MNLEAKRIFIFINFIIFIPYCFKIGEIKDELDTVRKLIRARESEGKDKVEQHLQDLRVQREELENVKSENNRFLQENNVLDIIKERKLRTDMMEALTTSPCPECQIPSRESLNGMYYMWYPTNRDSLNGVRVPAHACALLNQIVMGCVV